MNNRKYIRRNKIKKPKTQVRKYKGNPNHKLKSNQYYVKYKTRLSDNAINDEKIKSIKSKIRKNCSPKHVPTIIINGKFLTRGSYV